MTTNIYTFPKFSAKCRKITAQQPAYKIQQNINLICSTCSTGHYMDKKKYLKEFAGEWLLLFNDEIIDHSSNVEDILRLAEEKYPEDKFPEDTIKVSKVLSGYTQLH